MPRFRDMQCAEQIRRADREAGRAPGLRLPAPAWRWVFAGAVAANLLLMPVLSEAAVKGPKRAQASVPAASTGSAETKASPYAVANRQRQEAAKAANSPALPHSARRQSGVGVHGQRH